MSSYVAIANAAAIAVGTAARLTDPGDDTVLGRAVAAVWDIERRAVLREGAWNFAVKRETLPALVAPPKHSFTHQFQLPADCLKLIEISGWRRSAYQREGDRILCDGAEALQIRYLRDVEEPAEFDAAFAHAFALKIACAIGNRIAGSAFKEELNLRKYNAALTDARRADALENPPIRQEESAWVTARFVGETRDLNYVDGGYPDYGWWY